MPVCCAYGCNNSVKKVFKIYAVPKSNREPERRKAWLTMIKRVNFSAKKSTGLCEVHFEKKQFETKIPGKLKRNAVPTIFSHRPAISHRKSPKKRGQAGEQCSSRKRICLEHSYFDLKDQGPSSPIELPTLPAVVAPIVEKEITSSNSSPDPRIPLTSEEIESLKRCIDSLSFSGYCVRQFIRLNKNCEDCVKELVTKERPNISDLTAEKCYSHDSLTFASMPVLQILEIAEKSLLDLSDDVLKSDVVLPRLVNEALLRSEHLTLPDCHGVKKKLLSRYLRVRIFSYLSEKKTELKDKQKKRLKSQTDGSRSMAMRESVKNKK